MDDPRPSKNPRAEENGDDGEEPIRRPYGNRTAAPICDDEDDIDGDTQDQLPPGSQEAPPAAQASDSEAPSPPDNERTVHPKRVASASPEDSRRAKRNTTNTNAARPKASDFAPNAKHAVLAACRKFRALLASNGSFLEPTAEMIQIAEAFKFACEECDVSLVLTKDHMNVVRVRSLPLILTCINHS